MEFEIPEIRVVYAFGPQLNAFMAVGILLKVHLTPNFFSLNQIYLLFVGFGRKHVWICLNPRFSMPSQCRD